ncbi:phosphogluconate dehydrogenase C-terminal domain-containing protein [Rhizobium mayense]|uniref:Phosphogluconate dehydrogenase C-terminal domain-containing protein n=1 Tax=Rhizobium mayense TaxID=1312184 RepID=A0ABT7JZB2_9HYPH|nr:phosphogluconate dehydrogenase C-terminal domain-containing protein [Rhizobium mayense]MDL2401665.1 phosphogluconate dehydrogenase C-terminal domain-containing protein [Rhizobium mayense]
MAMSVAVLGAGGKMGLRVTKKLVEAGYDVRAVEIGDLGRERLAEAGIDPVGMDKGVPGANVVVMALPDNIIGKVARQITPSLSAGSMLIILDAAAPYAGDLPGDRPDLTYFVGHPCHPPLFGDETEWTARRDYHGGIAKQSIVCALMQGPEQDYARGEAICRAMWSPIIDCHRVTVEQLAILEPGLSEMVAMPFVDTMVEAVEECERKYGIPRKAALDFLIGHLNVEIAMWFGYSPKVPSDAALRLMRFAKGVVVKDDWREALTPAKVREASELIVYGKGS